MAGGRSSLALAVIALVAACRGARSEEHATPAPKEPAPAAAPVVDAGAPPWATTCGEQPVPRRILRCVLTAITADEYARCGL